MIKTSLDRERLLDRINRPSLAPITLITAPAGYGKSTLARQWAESFPGPIATIALTPESNTPSRMLAQIMQALRRAAMEANIPLPENVEPTLDSAFQLGKTIAEEAGVLAVILDDYHVIDNEDIHGRASDWLALFPPHVHILILSRIMPPLALGRLRAQGHVRHLTEADLSFTQDEVARLTQPARLSQEDVHWLTERTEGWITGIQLALMSKEHSGTIPRDEPGRILATSPHYQWLDDYIVEEVLNQLPDELREFVLRTSILETLHPELCDAMLETDSSARLLQQLRQRLVFVNPLAESPDRLVYHHLFAESVGRISHRCLTATRRRQDHLRAAHWFDRNNEPEPALNHALRAHAWDMAERLMTIIGKALSHAAQSHTMLFWLKKLPLWLVRKNMQFFWWYTKALMGSGQLHEGEQELEKIRPILEASDAPLHRAYLAYLDGTREVFTGENELALHNFHTVLRNLPTDAFAERLHSWAVVFQFESLRGNDEAADQAYREASALTPHFASNENPWLRHLEANRANHYALRADLVTAEAIHRHQLEHLSIPQRHYGARYRGFLAMIYLEWNELDRALHEISLVLETIRDGQFHVWHSELLLFASQIYRAAGDLETARELFLKIVDHYRTHGGENTMQRAESLRAVHWSISGDIPLARDWVERQQLPEHPLERIFGERDLRLPWLALYVTDKRWDDAYALVSSAITGACAVRHRPAQLQFEVWRAIIAQEMGDRKTASAALREAVRIGTPGRFVRSFFPLNHDLRPLLREIKPSLPPKESAWVNHLILHGPRLTNPADAPQSVPDRPPLTPSEERVLALLNQGYSNQDIAATLFVTERTVKKHVSNILKKLNAPNRTAAVSRALELEII